MSSDNKSLLTLLALVAFVWIIVTLALYTISAYLTKDILVFLTGGSRSLLIMFLINALVLAGAWASPLLFVNHQTINIVRGRGYVYVLSQVGFLLILSAGFYLLANRFILGFTPIGLEIQMTDDFQRVLIIKIAVFIGGAGLGSMVGLAMLFSQASKGLEVEVAKSEDVELRKRLQ